MMRVIPMVNNRKAHSSHDVFQKQANSSINRQRAGAVWQDKTARLRNRAGSAKPEPHGNGAQSRQTFNNSKRSQNHGSSKRRTVHLVLWVKPIVKAELQRVAAQEGLSMSKAAGTLLERALAHTIDTNYNALLTPVIEQAIKKELHSYNKQIALLLARTLFASEQTRSLSTNIMQTLAEVTGRPTEAQFITLQETQEHRYAASFGETRTLTTMA